MAATVTPIRPGVVPVERGVVQYAKPLTLPPSPCAVCGLGAGLVDYRTCDRCNGRMHSECCWGRVATLEEWRDYLQRWIEPEEWRDDSPPCVCPACRAKVGA